MAKQTVQSGQEPGIWQTILNGANKVADVFYPKYLAVMDDLRRRLVEEPWYGKPVIDVLHQTQSRSINQSDKGKAVEDTQTVKEGQTQQQPEFDRDTFYGRSHDKVAEQHHAFGRDDDLDQDLGMER